MRRNRLRAVESLALIGALAGLLPEAAWSAAGSVTHLSGAVVARRGDGQSQILSVKSEVREGDVIATAENSYARVKFGDGTEVVLRPNTQLKVDAFKYEEQRPREDNVLLSLLKGGLRSVTGLLAKRNAASFRVQAPNATIGIRGTSFGLLYCQNDCGKVPGPGGNPPANGLHVDVSDGAIVVSNAGGSQEFKVGQFGYVQTSQTPPVEVPPGQGTQVTLPPQALNQQILGGTVGTSATLECAIK
ncbi:MAG: hypothetical protein EPO27_08035 [Betaproteobacteria bacterium]|nr:MAG: hypothetical protein EPO27_08035 [Betaproteobacteria bacterium]